MEWTTWLAIGVGWAAIGAGVAWLFGRVRQVAAPDTMMRMPVSRVRERAPDEPE